LCVQPTPFFRLRLRLHCRALHVGMPSQSSCPLCNPLARAVLVHTLGSWPLAVPPPYSKYLGCFGLTRTSRPKGGRVVTVRLSVATTVPVACPVHPFWPADPSRVSPPAGVRYKWVKQQCLLAQSAPCSNSSYSVRQPAHAWQRPGVSTPEPNGTKTLHTRAHPDTAGQRSSSGAPIKGELKPEDPSILHSTSHTVFLNTPMSDGCCS
jgi:hypothetical protein